MSGVSVRMLRLVTGAYGAALCMYSLVPATFPGASLATSLPGRDLSAHALGYAVLALLVCGTAVSGGVRRWMAEAAAAGVAVSWAGVMELAQMFVPWRSASLTDLLAGALGAFCAVGLCGACGLTLDAWRRLCPGAGRG